MPTVNTSPREESLSLASRICENDAVDLNPLGGSTAEHAYMKTRKRLKVATWNVRTLYKSGKLDNLIQEAADLILDVLGIDETRFWPVCTKSVTS